MENGSRLASIVYSLLGGSLIFESAHPLDSLWREVYGFADLLSARPSYSQPLACVIQILPCDFINPSTFHSNMWNNICLCIIYKGGRHTKLYARHTIIIRLTTHQLRLLQINQRCIIIIYGHIYKCNYLFISALFFRLPLALKDTRHYFPLLRGYLKGRKEK